MSRVRYLLLLGMLCGSNLHGADGPNDEPLMAQLFQPPVDFSPVKIPDKPFWRIRPKVVARLRDDEDVVVSVTNVKKLDGRQFEIKGVGWARSSAPFAYLTAQRFEDLKKVSPHFQKVKYNSTFRRMLVRTEALGWYAKMLMQIQLEEDPQKGEFNIYWLNIEGSFKGMKGVVQMRSIEPQRCEISMLATYTAKKLPLPPMLLDLGLEFVAQRVAVKMRKVIESAFKQRRANSSIGKDKLSPIF